jgi:NAD(P)-dependent dehydrogenase (short-subunit alcohol dehydrogenase family)
MSIGDLTGTTAVITGGNSGIGFATAVALASAGATTLITARDAAKAAAAVADIRRRSGSTQVDAVIFDLGDLSSVRAGAARILERCESINVLINNAGVLLSERSETTDGLETTFAVNHLGHFLLTELLLDRITQSAPARIITVTSDAHRLVRRGLDFEDLQSTKSYRGLRVYSRTKLANIYFTRQLAERIKDSGVSVNCLHPGLVASRFARDGDSHGLLALVTRVLSPVFRTPEKAAREVALLAASGEIDGVTGGYFVKGKVSRPSAVAQDSVAAARLIELSTQLVAGSR